MTEQSFSETEISDFEVSSDDSATSVWVDQTIADAETNGYLAQLSQRVEEAPAVSEQEYAALVEQAMKDGAFAKDQPDYVPPVAPNRDAIRQAIFAKLRRPDGAPFAAGYQAGAAQRKSQYANEDTQAAWWGPEARWDDDYRTTRYEDRGTIDDRAATRGYAGRVYDANSQPVNGTWGWVIDADQGALLLFDPNDNQWFDSTGAQVVKPSWQTFAGMFAQGYKVRAIHHTSPVAGMPVTGAGRITLENGVIKEITDESGHYRPDAVQQHAAVEGLAADRYDLSQTEVRLTGTTMGERPTDKAGWINAAHDTNATFPTGDVSLTAEQFRQTQGDEYQIRAKQALNEQIEARGDRPGTEFKEHDPWGDLDSSLSDDSSLSEDAPQSGDASAVAGGPTVVRTEIVTHEDGTRSRKIVFSDGNYRLEDLAEGEGEPATRSRADSRSSSDSSDDSDDSDDSDAEGDSAEEDPDLQYIQTAKDYLAQAGHAAFATWFRGLAPVHQDMLLRDAEIGAAWRQENAAPAAPAWQPAEADFAAAATANSAFVDQMPDRGMANFTVAGLALMIGGGHAQQLADYAGTVADRFTGSVTVRKAAVGRGAGSLTFRGVPAAKQQIVRTEVARFSRKEVRFE